MSKDRIRNWLIGGIIMAYFTMIFPWGYAGKFIGKMIFNDYVNFSKGGIEKRLIIRDEGPKLLKIMETKVEKGDYTIQEYCRDMDKLRLIELKSQLPFLVLGNTEKFRHFIQKKYGNRKDFQDLVDKLVHQETPEKKQLIAFQKKLESVDEESWNQACDMFLPLIAQIYLGSLPFAASIIFCFILFNKNTTVKQEIILRPKKLLLCGALSFFGAGIFCLDFREAVVFRYWQAKGELMARKGWKWGDAVSKQEEELLWAVANMPVEKFDQALQVAFEMTIGKAIEKPKLAFTTTLLIWILSFPLAFPKKSYAIESTSMSVMTECGEARIMAKKLAEILKQKGIITEEDLTSLLAGEGAGVQKEKVSYEESKTSIAKIEDNASKNSMPKITGLLRVKMSNDNNALTLPNAWARVDWEKEGIESELRLDFGQPKTEQNRIMRARITLPLPKNPIFQKLTVGKFFDPAADQTPDPFLLRTIDYPKASLLPDDVGVEIGGKFSALKYSLAVVNGNGFVNLSDDNKKKDISGRAILDVEKLLKTDYFDELSFGMIFKKGEQPLPVGMRKSVGGDITFRKGPFWINGALNWFENSGRKYKGWWILSTYDLPYFMQVLAQVDTLDKEKNFTAGLNWKIRPKTELKLNYVHPLEAPPLIEKKDRIMLQLQQVF
jgi:hypothetical protein